MEPMNARTVESAKPRSARYEKLDPHTPGLRLIVQPSGQKSWAIRYTFNRVKRKHTLGPFPRLSLAEARDMADAALRTVAKGIDPAAAKALGTPSDETFEAAADLYIEKHVATLRSGTAAYVKRELADAKSAWRGRAIASITRRDVIGLLDAANERGKHAGNMTRKVLASLFTWAAGRDLIEISPVQGIKKTKTKKRTRYLDDGELRLVWQAAEKCGGAYGALAKLLILTGARRNEIARLEWDEVKADEIVLPPARNKTAEWLHIPITPLMRQILDGLPRRGRYVLGNGRPMSANMRAKDSLDVQLNEPWRYHDLRRSFVTGCARIGIPVQVVEKCVGHALAGVLAVYQQHDFTAEKRDAFMKWSEHIAAITAA